MEKASPLDRMPYSVRKEKLRQAKLVDEAKVPVKVLKPVSAEEEKAYVVEVQIPVTPEPILLQSKSPLEEPAVMSSPPAEPEPVVDNGPVEAEMVSSVVIETEELPEPEPVVVEEPIPAEPEPVAVEEAPVTGPEEAVVEEVPAEPAVVVEEAPAAPAEPAVVEEEAPAAPAEEAPVAPVEVAVVEAAVVEAAVVEAAVVEEAVTVTSEVVVEDVAELVQDEVIEPKVEEEVQATPIIEEEKVEAPPVVEEKEPTPPPVVEETPAAPVEEEPLELMNEEKRQIEDAEPEVTLRDIPGLSTILDLIYWRDVKKTGVVFGSMLFILLSLAIFSVLSVIAYLSLAILSVTLSFRVYKNIMQAVQKSGEGHPFKFYRDYLEWDLELNDQKTQKVVKLVMKHSNATVRELRRLFLVEDLVDSIKFGLLLWVLTYIGSWFNGMTLIINSVVIVFTLPKIYETYKVQIDNYLAMARSQFNKILQQVQSKLPFLKKKAKAQ